MWNLQKLADREGIGPVSRMEELHILQTFIDYKQDNGRQER